MNKTEAKAEESECKSGSNHLRQARTGVWNEEKKSDGGKELKVGFVMGGPVGGLLMQYHN